MSDETQIQLAEDIDLANYEDMLGDFFSKSEDDVPPPPPAGGFMRICPKVSVAVKDNNKLVRKLCADDAEDSGANFIVAPNFREKMVLIAPVTAAYGHEAWNNGQKVVDTPGSLDNCEYCLINHESDNEMDRCENHAKVAFFVINTNGSRDSKKWTVQGLYHVDQSSKSTFDEPYNFYFHEMRTLYKNRQVPFTRIYQLTLQTREKQFVWNIPRFVREDDDLQGGSFVRDGRGAPAYKSFDTPPHLVQEMAALLKPGTPHSLAVKLFQLSGKEAYEKMQENMTGRKAVSSCDKPKAAVGAGKVAKPTETSEDGVDAFLGGVD